MGLGGHMMWTAVAREIVEHHKKEQGDFKIIPTSGTNIINSEVFKNNPYFTEDESTNHFKMNLSNSQTNYCIKEENGKAHHRYDKHIIEQACEYYGINNPKLKCELYFTDKEINNINHLLPKDDFITIEPHSKIDYSPNNAYPFNKWQNVIDKFPNINFVQIGVSGKSVLNNAIDLTGKMSYREACYCIKKSKLFLGTVGGLMHGANAVNTKSIIVVTPYQHPRMACYDDNINIRIGGDQEFEKYGGLLNSNEELNKLVLSHDENEIIKKLKEYLNENK